MGGNLSVAAGGSVVTAGGNKQLPAARWTEMVAPVIATKLRNLRGNYNSLCNRYAPRKQNAAAAHEDWCVTRDLEYPCYVDATYGAGAFATWLAGQLLYHYHVLHHDEEFAVCEEIATAMACLLPQRPMACYMCFLSHVRTGRYGDDYGRQDAAQLCRWWREYNNELYKRYRRTALMLMSWDDADNSKTKAS